MLLGSLGLLIASQLASQLASPLERFEGSELRLVTESNLNTFAPSLQQTRNPTVESSLLLRPRFDAGNQILVSARFAVSYEWTDSDRTTLEHEAVLSDLETEAVWRGLPRLIGIETSLGVSAIFPTSKSSRARSLYFAPGALVQARRSFAMGGGSLDLILRGSYHRPVYRFTTPTLVDAPPYAPQCFGGGVGCLDQASGVANVRDRVEWRLFVTGSWLGLSPGLFLQANHQLPYAFDGGEQAVRVTTYFSAFLGYTPIDWLGFEVGYSMERNIIGGSGGYENPIWDRDEDMRLYFSLSFTPADGLRARRPSAEPTG